MAYDRMFQVIVLGGIGLVGAACGSTVTQATGGTTSGSGVGGFPQEGPIACGGGGFPQEGAVSSSSGMGGFPSETASVTTTSTSSGMGGFPQEGPVMPDAGSDASFPNETDSAPDAGAPHDGGFPEETAAP